jgi:hypothetical protein
MHITIKWIKNLTSPYLVMVIESVCLFRSLVEYVGPPNWAKVDVCLFELTPLSLLHEVEMQAFFLTCRF